MKKAIRVVFRFWIVNVFLYFIILFLSFSDEAITSAIISTITVFCILITLIISEAFKSKYKTWLIVYRSEKKLGTTILEFGDIKNDKEIEIIEKAISHVFCNDKKVEVLDYHQLAKDETE